MNNRELKFRVYIPDHEKFSYFRLGEFDYSDRYLYQHQYPVQQYTGLQDRNGKEIYEGDIIEYKLIRGSIPSNETVQEKINQEVKWQGAQFIGIHPIRKIGYYLVDKKPQVIGNIFENPELIKNDE